MKKTPQDVLRDQINLYVMFCDDQPEGSRWYNNFSAKIAEFNRAIAILDQHLKP